MTIYFESNAWCPVVTVLNPDFDTDLIRSLTRQLRLLKPRPIAFKLSPVDGYDDGFRIGCCWKRSILVSLIAIRELVFVLKDIVSILVCDCDRNVGSVVTVAQIQLLPNAEMGLHHSSSMKKSVRYSR